MPKFKIEAYGSQPLETTIEANSSEEAWDKAQLLEAKDYTLVDSVEDIEINDVTEVDETNTGDATTEG